MLALISWQIIPAIILTFLICLGLHTLDVDRIEAKSVQTVANQVTFDIKKCEAEKQITTNVSKDYETQINILNGQLDSLRRQPSKCVPVSQPAARCNATTKQPITAKPDGISSAWLYSYAGEAESYRLRLIACQSFISQVWANN